MKTLWIVSGGIEAISGIRRAKELGLHVVVSDGNPKAPGAAIADDFVLASTYDVDATIKAVADYQKNHRPVDGIISIAADVPLTVASVAQEFGLPGIPIETARLATDKLAMKLAFKEAGIPIPWFREVFSVDELKMLVREGKKPLIIKPVNSRGARGVLQLAEKVDISWAYHHAYSFSPAGRVMVEEFLLGPQISTESLIINGKGYTPGFSDRNYEYLEKFFPYIIENGGHQPSVLSTEDQKAITDCAVSAGLALGIHSGIAKGDMVLTSDGPAVIEIAARLSGGYFATDQIPLATGVDLTGAAIKIALGEDVCPEKLMPKHHKGVAIRYFFPEPGRVTAIHNKETARNIPGVYKLETFVSIGDVVEKTTNHTKRTGFVITEGDTRDEAIKLAKDVVRLINIETVPILNE